MTGDPYTRIREIRDDNRMGDVGYHDIVWLLGIAEAAYQLQLAAEAAPIPLSSATGFRWVELERALGRRRYPGTVLQ